MARWRPPAERAPGEAVVLAAGCGVAAARSCWAGGGPERAPDPDVGASDTWNTIGMLWHARPYPLYFGAFNPPKLLLGAAMERPTAESMALELAVLRGFSRLSGLRLGCFMLFHAISRSLKHFSSPKLLR